MKATDTDRRAWHIDKGIPVALLISIVASLFLGGVAYQSLKGDIVTLQTTQKEMREESKEIAAEVRTLTNKMQEGSVPSAQNAWRITQTETAIAKLESRVTAAEVRIADNERKLLRVDSAAATTSARVRAQGER